MNNYKKLCPGEYVSPTVEAVVIAAESVLCTSGERYDFNNSIGDLGSENYGDF